MSPAQIREKPDGHYPFRGAVLSSSGRLLLVAITCSGGPHLGHEAALLDQVRIRSENGTVSSPDRPEDVCSPVSHYSTRPFFSANRAHRKTCPIGVECPRFSEFADGGQGRFFIGRLLGPFNACLRSSNGHQLLSIYCSTLPSILAREHRVFKQSGCRRPAFA